MPKLRTAEDILALKEQMRRQRPIRIPQYREVVDGSLSTLDTLKKALAPDYQKVFVPRQPSITAKAGFRMVSIMASNQSEVRYKARAPDESIINRVQKHEDGHVAIDPLLFPMPVIRSMYSFLFDGYTIVALDVKASGKALAGYDDHNALKATADDDYEDDDDTPPARYARNYKGAKGTDTERHEAAYKTSTDNAVMEDGIPCSPRVIDPLLFGGFQVDGDPYRFAVGMEYGQKQLNPLLAALSGFGLVKGEDGKLWIESGAYKSGKRKGEKKRSRSASYEALGADWIAETSTDHSQQDEYVEYTQVRTCEETVILIEDPPSYKGDRKGDGGIVIRVPNPFGGEVTGYYLIPGDSLLRSGSLEDKYLPPLRHMMNMDQHFSVLLSSYEAMALSEATRSPYLSVDADTPLPGGADSTQETKSKQPEDGGDIPTIPGELKRVEGYGQDIASLLQLQRELLKEAEPTDIWGGTGSSSETGIAIARRETALLVELNPYQNNRAAVCKLIHQDVDRYVVASGQPIRIAYLPEEAAKGTKPEVREITPKTAKLPMDMDYIIGSDTPESKYAAEQMSLARVKDRVYGMTQHRETIGLKDPGEAERQMYIDDIVTEGMAMVRQAAAQLFGEAGKAQLGAAFGIPVPPDVVPQGGMPGAPPTQTLPGSATGVPVTPGGPAAIV